MLTYIRNDVWINRTGQDPQTCFRLFCFPSIHQLPDAEFIEELRRFNGTPQAVPDNPELMEVFLPLLRSYMCLDETYVYDHEAPLKTYSLTEVKP